MYTKSLHRLYICLLQISSFTGVYNHRNATCDSVVRYYVNLSLHNSLLVVHPIDLCCECLGIAGVSPPTAFDFSVASVFGMVTTHIVSNTFQTLFCLCHIFVCFKYVN